MAKVIRVSCGPDHPIFSGGLQSFVPVSRPSTTSSSKSTAGTNQESKPIASLEPEELAASRLYEQAISQLPSSTELPVCTVEANSTRDKTGAHQQKNELLLKRSAALKESIARFKEANKGKTWEDLMKD